jgi:signal transduction histidine kinase/CheY-like chemotaxis protein
MKLPLTSRLAHHRNVGLTRGSLALIAAIILLTCLAGAAAVVLMFRSAEANDWVNHTFDVQRGARDLLNEVLSADEGVRGYLLSRDKTYLEPYNSANSSQSDSLKHLFELTADNPSQQERLEAIGASLSRLRALFNQMIAMASDQDRPSRTLDLGVLTAIKSLMDETRADLDQFVDAEQKLLIARQSMAAYLQRALAIAVIAALAAAIVLAVVLGRITELYIEHLDLRTAELENENRLRVQAEATLVQSQKMDAIGQLTGGIAHDFNNMLTVVIGGLDAIARGLARRQTERHDDREFVASMQRSVELATQGAEKAAQLTHRLLAFARQQPLAPKPTDLNLVIRDMIDLLRRTIGEAVDLETVFGGGLWLTFVDQNQLENVLVNLVINARDAMPEGGKLTVETANVHLDDTYVRQFGDVTAGQYALLSVTDTGAGMANDVLQRVFEPFFTTKKGGTGSGLGLPMVHGFVKQSGGHIRIYSEIGHGTTVKLYLPRHVQSAVTATPPALLSRTEPMPRAQREQAILVVEDSQEVRQFAKTTLEELGYAVVAVADGLEAVRTVRSGTRFDLLFTDVVLSGALNGRELAQLLREGQPSLPVLYTTGYTRNAIVHNGRLDADVDFIQKPYSQRDLALKLRELLDRPS